MYQQILLVFVGGGLGSLCRFGISHLVAPWVTRFPWATLLSNAFACLLLGVFMAWQWSNAAPEPRRLLLVTGFCGGFSTFSTFTYESIQLFEKGQPGLAFSNVLLNLVICCLCVLLGLKLVDYGN